jgi:hypothetical protein
VAAIAAGLAAITTLVLPTLLLLGSGGEICPGYQVDVGMYYAKLAPLTFVAAVLGFAAVFAWPRLFGESETRSSRVGCGIAAIAAAGVGCALTSCVLSIIPGC